MGMEQSILSAIQAAPKNVPTDISTSGDFQAQGQKRQQADSLERGATADTLAVTRRNETLISSGLVNFVNNARSQQTRSMV